MVLRFGFVERKSIVDHYNKTGLPAKQTDLTLLMKRMQAAAL